MPRIRMSTGGSGIGNAYPLSESIHMTLIQKGKADEALNSGYGMLFAPAVILPDQTISERLAVAPGFVHADSGFALLRFGSTWPARKRTPGSCSTGQRRTL